MPNWCSNKVVVTGTESERSRLRELLSGPAGDVDFNKVKPMPEALQGINSGATEIDGVRYRHWRTVEEPGGAKRNVGVTDDELADLKEQYGASDWYSWNCDNWGTKWNACDSCVSDDGTEETSYEFETAWSPPMPVFETVSAMFPTLVFMHMYIDEGMGFGGTARYAHGELSEYVQTSGDGIRCLSDWHEEQMGWDTDEEEESVDEDEDDDGSEHEGGE